MVLASSFELTGIVIPSHVKVAFAAVVKFSLYETSVNVETEELQARVF